MKKFIERIIKNPLFSGSLVMIIGSNFTNGLNYIYHLIMGRLLGPVAYSELAVVLSLIGLLSIIPSSLGPFIVRYVSSSKNELAIKGLVNWLNYKFFIFSLIIAAVIAIGSFFIASFLNIRNPLTISISAIAFLFLLPSVLNRSVLQGLLRFKHIVLSVLAENGTKLVMGLLFVYLGFSVVGAIFGLVLAALSAWIVSRIFIKDFFKKPFGPSPDTSGILSFSIPVLVQLVAVTSLFSTDLILVKHFFSATEAGIYAALSTLGKIIFFGAGPITNVMFPLVSKKSAENKSYNKVFFYSFILTISLITGILLIYWLFPVTTINILYGSSYLGATHLLIWFGIFSALYTLSFMLINFHLSLGKVKVVVLPLIAAALQIIGIMFFHNTLDEVIQVSIGVTALLFISLLIYLNYATEVSFRYRSRVQARENYRAGFIKDQEHP